MNTIHNNGENDQSLHQDLEKLSQVYAQQEQDEPPDLLDQAVLNSAHRALKKKPRWMQFGWLHGLATAAVFVLAFTIILDQRESAPLFKQDILLDSPSRMEAVSELKKQSVDKISKSNIEKESSDISQQGAPASRALGRSEEDQNENSLQRARRDLSTRNSTAGKSERTDKDALTSGYLQEEILMEAADAVAESPPVDTASMPITAAAAAKPVSSATEVRAETDDANIEQELQTIIELKKSGDESWVTELEAFVERYPDYPLPAGLKD